VLLRSHEEAPSGHRRNSQAREEERAAQSRQEWEAEWCLPQDVPPGLRLEVTEAIRRKLPELYTSAGHAEDLVEVALRAVVEKTLRPFRRRREAEAAKQGAGLQWSAGNTMIQRHAFQELHHDERLAFILRDFVDSADVGMV
jgi:hypothetical protein